MFNFVILCGGLGKRFQKISRKVPKILIEIKPGLPMLDWLVEYYLPPNSKVILATGHLRELVQDFVSKKSYRKNIIFSHEEKKLGTGGAIIKASRLIQANEFIAINGDTIQELKIEKFMKKSILKEGDLINIGCTTSDLSDSGKLLVDSENFITSFTEKKLPKVFGLNPYKLCSSIGMYRCNSNYFKNLEIENKSFEEDILPLLVQERKAKASIFIEEFQDFGTFSRYNKLINNEK